MEHEQLHHRSKKPFVIIGSAVIIIAIICIAIVMAIGTPKSEEATTADNVETTERQSVATNEEVQQNLKDLDASIKQASSDQQTAKTSLDDGKKQVKVGS